MPLLITHGPYITGAAAVLSLIFAAVNFRLTRHAGYFEHRRTALLRAWRWVFVFLIFLVLTLLLFQLRVYPRIQSLGTTWPF